MAASASGPGETPPGHILASLLRMGRGLGASAPPAVAVRAPAAQPTFKVPGGWGLSGASFPVRGSSA